MANVLLVPSVISRMRVFPLMLNTPSSRAGIFEVVQQYWSLDAVAEGVVDRDVIKSLRRHPQSGELIGEGVGRAAVQPTGTGRLQRGLRQPNPVRGTP